MLVVAPIQRTEYVDRRTEQVVDQLQLAQITKNRCEFVGPLICPFVRVFEFAFLHSFLTYMYRLILLIDFDYSKLAVHHLISWRSLCSSSSWDRSRVCVQL